jgi:hypothetical protein
MEIFVFYETGKKPGNKKRVVLARGGSHTGTSATTNLLVCRFWVFLNMNGMVHAIPFLLIIYYSTFVGIIRFGYVPNNWCGTSCDVVLDLKWVPLVLIILTQGTKDERDHIVCIGKKKQNRRNDLRALY